MPENWNGDLRSCPAASLQQRCVSVDCDYAEFELLESDKLGHKTNKSLSEYGRVTCSATGGANKVATSRFQQQYMLQ